MSLLADLLSKIQQPQSKREIPPNLKNIVQASARRSSDKKKIIMLSALFVSAVLAGLLIIYFIRTFTEAKNSGITFNPLEINAKVDMPEQALHDKSETQPLPEQNISDKTETADKPAISSETEATSEQRHSVNKEPAQKETASKETEGSAFKENTVETTAATLIRTKTIDSDKLDSYLYGAREYEMKKDYSKALAEYKKALELDEKNFTVLNNIAYLYLLMDVLDDSVIHSLTAVEIKSDYAPALTNLGIAYARSGKISEAEVYLSRAFKLEPDNMNIIMNLAILHERQNQFVKASEYFTRLARLGNVSGSLGLARIYEKQDRIDEALDLYRSIHEKDAADNRVRALVRKKIAVLKRGKMKSSPLP